MKGSGEGKTIGHVAKDLKFPGAFMDAWRAFWAKAGKDFETADITGGLTLVMAPKDEAELAVVKKASQATSDVFSKYLKEQIMDIIDGDKVRTLRISKQSRLLRRKLLSRALVRK